MGRVILSFRSSATPFPCLVTPLIIPLLIFILSSCAASHKTPFLKTFGDQEIKTIIANMQEQDKVVFSFYSLGTVLVKNWLWESEANILIMGRKRPLKIKIEITHPWGQPILHILIDEPRLEVLSFRDNRLYIGDYTPQALSKFIPGDLDSNLIWATLRGYPTLLDYDRIGSSGGDQINLFNGKGKEVERITISPDSLLPRLIFLPENFIKLAFSDWQENEGIYNAGEVRLDDMEGKRELILKSKKTVFNKALPDQIFVMEKPPHFETFDLSKYEADKGQ